MTNTAEGGVFPASTTDRAVAVDLVLAARRGDQAALDGVLARPRAHAPLTAGSPLHLLGAWHTATVTRRFDDAPSTSPAFDRHVVGTARAMAALGQPVTDERVSELLRFWVQVPAGAGRSSIPAVDDELTALATSLAGMLLSAETTESEARRCVDEVADSITVSTDAALGIFSGVDRDWTDGAATMVMLTRARRHNGKFVSDGYAGASERAGMIVDLAFHLRTADLPAMASLSPDAVDFGPARRLLRAMAEQPQQPLAHWIGKGPTLSYDLAEQWATDHLPTAAAPEPKWLRGYVDKPTHERQATHIEQHFAAIAANPSTDPYENAIAVVLATTGRLWTGSYRSWPELLRSCGPVADLALAIQEFMVDTRLRPQPVGYGF